MLATHLTAAPTSWVGADVRLQGGAILKRPDFTQESPRKLLPTRGKERQTRSYEKR